MKLIKEGKIKEIKFIKYWCFIFQFLYFLKHGIYSHALYNTIVLSLCVATYFLTNSIILTVLLTLFVCYKYAKKSIAIVCIHYLSNKDYGLVKNGK
jgi:hypothetical protein